MKITTKRISNISTLLFLLTFLLSFSTMAELSPKDCMYKKNTICQKLITLRPRLDHEEAYKLSNHFHKLAKKYQLSADLLISIAFQESAFRLETVRKITGLIFDDEKQSFREMRLGSDFCMMQINTKNIRNMKLDVKKLLNDTAYCIEAGAKILATYKVLHSKKNKKWWTFYNAVHESKREIYFKHVTRHLKKISKTKAVRAISSKE
jgi:hypothetical protein